MPADSRTFGQKKMTEKEFPVLHTDRLIMRQVTQADAPVVLAGYGNPDIYKHMGVSYHSLEEVQAQLEWYKTLFSTNAGLWWGFCLADTGQMIGNGGFHRWDQKHHTTEVGYWLLPDFHRQGYGTEVLGKMTEYAYQVMNVHRVEAVVEMENTSSSRLLTSSGFTLEGIRRQCEWKNDAFIDLQIWSKLSTD